MHRTRLYEQVGNNANESLMQHLAMVKRVAVHLKVRLPPMMELAELVQIGVIGLLEASRTFDPTKGVDFEDFAYNRIRGAIIDEVRRMSSMPRSAIANLKQHGDAAQALANREPIPEEPQAARFQKIKSGETEVYVYMPDEFVNDIFALGAKYQRTQITAQQAIDAVQNIVNQLCRYELGLEEPFQALTFLREELEAQAKAEEEARQAQAGDGGGEDV